MAASCISAIEDMLDRWIDVDALGAAGDLDPVAQSRHRAVRPAGATVLRDVLVARHGAVVDAGKKTNTQAFISKVIPAEGKCTTNQYETLFKVGFGSVGARQAYIPILVAPGEGLWQLLVFHIVLRARLVEMVALVHNTVSLRLSFTPDLVEALWCCRISCTGKLETIMKRVVGEKGDWVMSYQLQWLGTVRSRACLGAGPTSKHVFAPN